MNGTCQTLSGLLPQGGNARQNGTGCYPTRARLEAYAYGKRIYHPSSQHDSLTRMCARLEIWAVRFRRLIMITYWPARSMLTHFRRRNSNKFETRIARQRSPRSHTCIASRKGARSARASKMQSCWLDKLVTYYSIVPRLYDATLSDCFSERMRVPRYKIAGRCARRTSPRAQCSRISKKFETRFDRQCARQARQRLAIGILS